ncbi:MAG: FG-GAP-like repeat-containing protein, partial [Bryobacteraceae bacterium]
MTCGMVRCLAAYGLLSLAFVVSAATVSLSSSATPSAFGAPVILMASVSPSGTGTVTFYDGATILGIGALASDMATIQTILLTPGKHSLRARYEAATPKMSPALPFVVKANAGSSLSITNTLTAGKNPFSVAVGDFNGKGNADLAVANYTDGTVDILLGNGTGAFMHKGSPYATGGNLTSIATGYFHGNDNVDLVVTDVKSNAVWMLTANGDGTFQAPVMIATTTSPYAVAVSDFNRDGNSDIAVVNNTTGTVT